MIPCRYLEQTALAARDTEGAAYTAVKFRGSAHVAHLRTGVNILLKQVLYTCTGGYFPEKVGI